MQTNRSSGYYYTGSLLAALSLPVFMMYFIFMLPGSSDAKGAAFAQNPIFLIGSLLLIIAAPIATTIYYKKHQKPEVQEYINISTIRYVVAFLMIFYGFAKMGGKFFEITYFTQDSRVADVDSFSLTWFYFGKSNVQEFLIGLLEFIPAVLLLFRRTAFLGTLLLLPVSLNVMMINTFNHISGLTFPVSIFISLCNVYLLFAWKDELIAFFRKMILAKRPQLPKAVNIIRIVFKIVIIATIVYFIFGEIFSRIINRHHFMPGRNKIKGGFELAQLTVNNKAIPIPNNDSLYYKSIYLEPQSRWNCIVKYGTIEPHALTVLWNKKSDSVITFIKKNNSVTTVAVDSTTMFKGTYKEIGNKLYIKGIQYGDTINAVYNKKDLRDYNWFW